MTRSVSKNSRKSEDEKVSSFSLFTNDDLHLFNEGNHFHLYKKLGARRIKERGGTYFSVWAPNAKEVHVVGDFNGWEKGRHHLKPIPHDSVEYSIQLQFVEYLLYLLHQE